MRKKLVSLALAATIMVSTSLPAFAADRFNKSVFDGQNNISVKYDDMTAITIVKPQLEMFGETYTKQDSGMIFVESGIAISDTAVDSLDMFSLDFKYYGYDWADLNEIWIKVGSNRYHFSNCYTAQSVEFDGLAYEYINISLKNETLPFMQDFLQHQNEEIKVRLEGDSQTFDFVLNDDMKNCIIFMYNLFVNGGGTRQSNMDNMSQAEYTVVERNFIVLS